MEKFLTLRAIEIMEACQGFRNQGLSASPELVAMEDEAIRDLAEWTFAGDDPMVSMQLKKKYKQPMNGYEMFLASQIEQN